MEKIELFGLDIEVEIDETEVVGIEVPEEYEKVAVTTDGRVIGFDESIGQWVQLKGSNY